MKTLLCLIILFSILLTVRSTVFAQGDTLELYASGLINPMGIEIDSQGRLWVAEAGTGSNDGRVSIITQDGVAHPFITGLPSVILQGDPSGTAHLKFDVDGKLLVLQGSGPSSYARSVLIIDTSGFVPGNPPLSLANIEDTVNLGKFAVSNGAEMGNPFRIVIGPEDDWFIVDANLNGIIRREKTTGNLSLFTLWGNIVPTGIVFFEDKFFTGSLTSFPFISGTAKIYEVDLSGNDSVLHENLTTIIDLNLDPADNKLVALQHAIFNNGYLLGTGAVLKFNNGTADTLYYGLNRPTALKFDSKGNLFISSAEDGNIYVINNSSTNVDNTQEPIQTFHLKQNYPNPFNPETNISWYLPSERFTTIKIYDVLGEEVAVLVNELKNAGTYNLLFNASALSSGVYFYKIEAGEFTETKKLILMK